MNHRQRIDLDGTWQFQIDPTHQADRGALTDWRTATVPLPWQAQFDDLRHTSGTAWYARHFYMPQVTHPSAILHFGAVDYHATVWLNGRQVGEHEGGYLPFEFEVAELLQAGENELVVKVVDPEEDPRQWPAYPFSEIPHGKQSWYGPISGIWQSVWLELRPACHLQTLRLTPDLTQSRLTWEIQLSAPCPKFALDLTILDPHGIVVAQTTVRDDTHGTVALDSATIAPWTPETPHLYTVNATLRLDEQPVDHLSATCGFRTVEARAGRIYLNGEPLYLRGVLDQAYYPETIYTPPSLDFLEDQIRKAKALGLNCLRCHIKIEDPRYYEAADRLGILIWTEIPNWAILSDEAADRAKETFRQMVDRDWNHPSIIAWTLINENWGTDLARNPDHRRWLADFTAEARAIDPTRLVVDNSACAGNFHVAGDIEDFHHYRAIPDHALDWDAWVAEFADRANWAWADDYAETRRSDLPLLVSEFGNWGLPNPANIREQGREPWWFETGFNWGDGIVYPHNFQARFDYWQLAQVFGSFEDFIALHQRHMALSLTYEVASMRLKSAIGGYVITEFTDVHWECNGLLDMRRNVKQHLDPFVALNQDQVVVIRPKCWAGRAGEDLAVEVRAFGVDGPGDEGTLHWQAGSVKGSILAPGEDVEIPLPVDAPAGMMTIQAEWRSAVGDVLARNSAEVAWAAPVMSQQTFSVIDDPTLGQALRQLGYNTSEDSADEAHILVARHYSETLQARVQEGANLLLLLGPDAIDDTPPLPVGYLVARAGTPWQGDWATSFSWLRQAGPFADLPGSPLLHMPYADLMPDAVIAGLPALLMQHRSWAGLALGWLHKPVSLLTDFPYGRGRIIATTFKLTPTTLIENVLAQNLFSGILELF